MQWRPAASQDLLRSSHHHPPLPSSSAPAVAPSPYTPPASVPVPPCAAYLRNCPVGSTEAAPPSRQLHPLTRARSPLFPPRLFKFCTIETTGTCPAEVAHPRPIRGPHYPTPLYTRPHVERTLPSVPTRVAWLVFCRHISLATRTQTTQTIQPIHRPDEV